jgi:tetratricopeptide (TPR) repeat protein
MVCVIGLNSANAQQDTPSNLIYIGCAAEFEAYEGFAEGRGIQLVQGCYGDVLSQVVEALEQQGINLVVASNEQQLSQAVLFLYAPLNIHGSPLASLEDLKPAYLNISPFLAAHPTGAIGLYADSVQKREVLADLMTGIVLYSVKKCEAAMPYFNLAESAGFYTDEGEPLIWVIASIRFYRGNCALLDGDYETAKQHYEAAFPQNQELNPNPLLELNIQANLAWTYLQLGEVEACFDLMERVVEAAESMTYTNRFRIAALTYRAQLYALAFRYDDALADMDAAIELDPTNPELYVLRGQITLYIYEWDRVLADYNYALELDPDYADAYYYRGILFYTQAQREQALPDFQRYLELAPDGDHAADAAQYIADIQRELQTLNE